MHVGDEIEGSFHTGRTLFVDADELMTTNTAELINIAETNKCTAIYLGASRTRLVDAHAWPAAALTGNGFAITAELFLGDNHRWVETMKTHYPQAFEEIHIIMSLDDMHTQVLRELKPSDDIKVQEQDHGRLWVWRLDSAATVTTYPEDYTEDRPVAITRQHKL